MRLPTSPSPEDALQQSPRPCPHAIFSISMRIRLRMVAFVASRAPRLESDAKPFLEVFHSRSYDPRPIRPSLLPSPFDSPPTIDGRTRPVESSTDRDNRVGRRLPPTRRWPAQGAGSSRGARIVELGGRACSFCTSSMSSHADIAFARYPLTRVFASQVGVRSSPGRRRLQRRRGAR